MAIPASFWSSILTPYVPIGSSAKGDANSLGQFGQMMAGKKSDEVQEQRLRQQQEFQQKAAEDAKRQKALADLHTALQDPDDWAGLQFAIESARGSGIEVSGVENWRPKFPESEERPLGEAVPTTPSEAGEAAHEGLKAQAVAKAVAPETLDLAGDHSAAPYREDLAPEGPPDWLSSYMASQLGQTPEPPPVKPAEWLQGYMQHEQGVAPIEESKPILPEQVEQLAAQAASIPDPQGVKAGPPGPPPGMGQMDQMAAGVPPERDDDVVISMDGRPMARITARDVQGYRDAQSKKVAQVFTPFIQNARSPSEQRAAAMAQEAAGRAAQGGLSRAESIAFGADTYNKALGHDLAVEKMSAYGKGRKGGGSKGPSFKERAAERLENKSDFEIEKGITAQQNQLYDVRKGKSAIRDARTSIELLKGDTIAQNTAVTKWVHSLAGSAQTVQEMQNLTGGLEIPAKLEELYRRWIGGDRSDQMRRQLSGTLKTMVKGLLEKGEESAEEGYQTAIVYLNEDAAERIYRNLAGHSRPGSEKKKEEKKEPPKGDAATKRAKELLGE